MHVNVTVPILLLWQSLRTFWTWALPAAVVFSSQVLQINIRNSKQQHTSDNWMLQINICNSKQQHTFKKSDNWMRTLVAPDRSTITLRVSNLLASLSNAYIDLHKT